MIKWPAEVAPTLNAHFGDKQGLEDQHALNGAGHFVPVAFRTTGNDGCYETGNIVGALDTTTDPNARVIAFTAKDHGADAMDDCAPTLRDGGHSKSHANAGVMPAVAFGVDGGDIRHCLRSGASMADKATSTTYVAQSAVRRLTPRECERLQGFPDDFTQIPWRGKEPEDCPDGPRYKTLGNSMAVPVMRWIGERIAMVDAL